MTTTPLPPLPTPKGKVYFEAEPYQPAWVSSSDAFDDEQMQAYATAARAALEVENQRLREALATLQMQCNSVAASNWREWQELASPQEFERWVKSRAVHMEALARAALENKP